MFDTWTQHSELNSSPRCHHTSSTTATNDLVSLTPWLSHTLSPTYQVESDISPPPGFACWCPCSCMFWIWLSASSHPCVVLSITFARFCLQVAGCKYQVLEAPECARWVVLVLEPTAQGSALRQKPYTRSRIWEEQLSWVEIKRCHFKYHLEKRS